MTVEIIHKGRDNLIGLQLSHSEGYADFTSVTKVELISVIGDGDVVSSDTNPEWFDWTEGNGIIRLQLGNIPDLVIGENQRFSIVLFDVGNLNGIDWGEFETMVK